MEKFISSITDVAVSAGSKLLLALLVFIIGRIVINSVVAAVKKSKVFATVDNTVALFGLSFVRALLYVILVVSIIGILGVPMASIVTVLASAGVAVGMSLQGALSNLAGGIMLMVFKPFKVNDYVQAGGAEGTVREISLFYTVITTNDNKRITVPNGSMMNGNVVNFSSEELRRVDLVFSCSKNEAPAKITNLLLGVIMSDDKILKDPAPFARLSGGTDTAAEYTVRAWCKGSDYWDVYFDVTQGVAESFAYNNVTAPAVRVLNENTAK